jgi:hypothetical protein
VGARAWTDRLTGPFHLDYEDSYGILVEGRDRPPSLIYAPEDSLSDGEKRGDLAV